MLVEQAQIIERDQPKTGMVVLQTNDTKKFVGKSQYCRKFISKSDHSPHIEPVWFFNELVYSELAKLAGLNMPEHRVMVNNEGELFFGSEYCDTRKPLESSVELKRLFDSDPTQLTRALLLDLLLFNNDRTFGRSGDIFSDGERLYFIDHGHALFGDGRCFGDLHRIECECYNSDIVKGYISGFLRCAEANQLVWSEHNQETVQSEYDTVRKFVPGRFEQTCREIEAMRNRGEIKVWEARNGLLLQPRLVGAMEKALSRWTSHLDCYFRDASGRKAFRKCLPPNSSTSST
jgi:hypothetical protein